MACLKGNAHSMRHFLLLINFFLVITGITILWVGTTVQDVFYPLKIFLNENFYNIPWFFIAIGVIIFIAVLFGCCVAYTRNNCMMLMFSILIIAIFILELLAGISGFMLRNDTSLTLTGNLNSTMQDYTSMHVSEVWDSVQQSFQCCGSGGPVDWLDKPINGIPVSCCVILPGSINTFNCTSANAFVEGCRYELIEFIEAYAVKLATTGVTLTLIQLVGIFLTCIIAHKMNRRIHTETQPYGFPNV